MLYKIGSMGYLGGVAKVSRGPWFRDYWVEDDGLDWFYTFLDSEGNKCWLLSNNLSLSDRNQFGSLYNTMLRNNQISWFAGLWLGLEVVTKDSYMKTMALGWKFTSVIGLGYLFKSCFMYLSAPMYEPLIGAYLRKYSTAVKRDIFEITDAKKQYFYIDTSEYMNYSNKDLGDEYHAHHGPQPVSDYFGSLKLNVCDLYYRKERASTPHGS